MVAKGARIAAAPRRDSDVRIDVAVRGERDVRTGIVQARSGDGLVARSARRAGRRPRAGCATTPSTIPGPGRRRVARRLQPDRPASAQWHESGVHCNSAAGSYRQRHFFVVPPPGCRWERDLPERRTPVARRLQTGRTASAQWQSVVPPPGCRWEGDLPERRIPRPPSDVTARRDSAVPIDVGRQWQADHTRGRRHRALWTGLPYGRERDVRMRAAQGQQTDRPASAHCKESDLRSLVARRWTGAGRVEAKSDGQLVVAGATGRRAAGLGSGRLERRPS